jgi:hypothetical protein
VTPPHSLSHWFHRTDTCFPSTPVPAIFLVVKQPTAELLIVVLALAFSCSCSAQQPSRPFKLPSGRVVRVLGTGRIDFPKGPPALMLKYETDLKISDMDALRKEADEIFAVLKRLIPKTGSSNLLL